MTEIFPVRSAEDSIIDVVFLHGLDGDARTSWSGGDDQLFWPQWLAEDVEHAGVWTIDYDAWSSRLLSGPPVQPSTAAHARRAALVLRVRPARDPNRGPGPAAGDAGSVTGVAAAAMDAVVTRRTEASGGPGCREGETGRPEPGRRGCWGFTPETVRPTRVSTRS
ncbi:hypothetical protein [Actinoplanes subtropicus]|uniref:hypothetical protein n=1 Tax=Actinoplanes subtropicus TaxID=543632 RepID=UPI00146FF5CD|nr:hypothetical protein [Actinoplanes subtropicus]